MRRWKKQISYSCSTVIQTDVSTAFHSQWMGKGSSSVSWLISVCVASQAKIASASSLVAAYWRVESMVDRPVSGSSFKWLVITTAGKARWQPHQTHVHTHTDRQTDRQTVKDTQISSAVTIPTLLWFRQWKSRTFLLIRIRIFY